MSIYKRLIGRRNGVAIWLVDGKLIRDRINVDFTFGGHHYVYPFIPRNEVWIDASVNKNEIWVTILHELTERALMQTGASYQAAHRKANIAERQARQEWH